MISHVNSYNDSSKVNVISHQDIGTSFMNLATLKNFIVILKLKPSGSQSRKPKLLHKF